MIGYYDIDGIVLSGTVRAVRMMINDCAGVGKTWKGKKKKINKIKREKYTLVNRISRGSKSSLSLSRRLFHSVPSFELRAVADKIL